MLSFPLQAQMVRRVKAYLSKMPVISDEEALMKLSTEVEPPPPQQQQTSQASLQQTLKAQASSVSLTVSSVYMRY